MSKLLQLQQLILDHMDFTESITDLELQELIYEVLRKYGQEEYLSIEERIQFGKALFNSFRKLDFLQELLEDTTITEIMINGTNNIFVEREGKITKLSRRFEDKNKLEDVVQQIVAGTNRIVNESTPIADARLSDGSRVHIMLPPVALNGPIVTIRKFQAESICMEQLLEWNSVDEGMISLLEQLVIGKYNIMISGGTGSGKTTFLNVLSEYIPGNERIITIEDNAELQLKGISNLVRMEARNANVEGEGAISIRQLIRASLRMRPDRIIVGECRGAEIIDLLFSAMNTGHDGSLSSIHANSIEDTLSRIETLVLMEMDGVPIEAIRRQVASAIDILIHVSRLRDGSRKVMEISEVIGVKNNEIQLSTMYKFEEKGVKNEKIQGHWVHMNPLVHREKLMAAGYKEG